jgi:hypothetical protein
MLSNSSIHFKQFNKTPLCNSSPISVYNLNLQFFNEKIDHNDYFFTIRQQHGFWDIIVQLIQSFIENSNGLALDWQAAWNVFCNIDIQNDDNLLLLANIMQNNCGDWKVKQNILYELLQIVTNELPDNIIYCVSDEAYYFAPFPTHSWNDKGFDKRHCVMEKFLLKKECCNAMIWRKAAMSGELNSFFRKYADHRIVLIGPAYFYDFNKRVGLNCYQHISIPLHGAYAEAEKIVANILDVQSDNTIYLLVAGGVAGWISFELQKNIKKAFVIDIGRALDVYYSEMASFMGWKWLEWRCVQKWPNAPDYEIFVGFAKTWRQFCQWDNKQLETIHNYWKTNKFLMEQNAKNQIECFFSII